MSVKASLKSAKAAIDSSSWGDAVKHALDVLSTDPSNYFAKLFLGRAYDKLGDNDKAAGAYHDAARLRPAEKDPWMGLKELYAGMGKEKVEEYINASWRLAEMWAENAFANGEVQGEEKEKQRCQAVVDGMVSWVKKNASRRELKFVLEKLLPGSEVYRLLEGRIQHPSLTYRRLAEMVEEEEKERVNTLVGERRTRLGARLGRVQEEVKREVYAKSNFEELCRQVVDWSDNDEVRREYDEKLLTRAYETLIVLPQEEKDVKRSQVLKLAEGMVIIKHPFLLAWQITLEWKDVQSVAEFDVNILREFIENFRDNGLAEVLRGYLGSDISPFPQIESDSEDGGVALDKDDAEGAEDEAPATLDTEDVLVLTTDGIDKAKTSALAHRLVGEYFVHIDEHESAVETMRKGLKLLATESQRSGLTLQDNLDAMNSVLATSLVQYQSPRNHPEAKAIFDDVLTRKPAFTPALIGVGLILEEEEEYADAVDFLSRAYERDSTNLRIGAEAAWCKALNGDLTSGLADLKDFLSQLNPKDSQTRTLRAQTCYRIGICQWNTDSSKAARKDRKGPYAMFLQAIKIDPNLAPAYTSLGLYYADYAKDTKRARQCFQKAFELSASEIGAAERLARSFANQGEWDIVEVVAQRVVDSGKAKPPPGSKKKKGVSWPYSALGVVQMNKQEYSKSVVSFLAALRINPDDYHSYVGLGESYHNSGRYNSAARTFNFAETAAGGMKLKGAGDSWFTRYMLSNVNRELGDYDTAIAGYEAVLQERAEEFGVAIALLQTHIERSWRKLQTGFFGQAAASATKAIDVAVVIARYKSGAFNLWKAVGDACAVFSWVQSGLDEVPLAKLKALLESGIDTKDLELFSDIDQVGHEQLQELVNDASAGDDIVPDRHRVLTRVLHASILAQKRAIASCAHDIHARAVSWYNLGWTEYRAHVCLEQDSDPSTEGKKVTRFLKAAMQCFKQAIELEAGNSDFWNALGVVTTQLNPRVAQHCFVRGLHLNERSVATWTNLGTLYLLQNDLDLAHQSFQRAQSTDPEYAHAWVGEGLIALLVQDPREALSHFNHAFEISDSASVLVKQQYALSTFDHILTAATKSGDMTSLIQPLFALLQLGSQTPSDTSFRHLSALFFERVGDHGKAINTLELLCGELEIEFETSESLEILSKFASAKADLARSQLAAADYARASETAETVLDLTSEADSTALDASTLSKVRLSARLTLGLSQHYLSRADKSSQSLGSEAIATFRLALEDSSSSADVVCLLATVLWADGGADEKTVARDQLFTLVGEETQNIDAIVLLGAMAAIEQDIDAQDAVREELVAIRAGSATLDVRQARRVEQVLDAIASFTNAVNDTRSDPVLTSIQNSVMLSPARPHGWAQLAQESDESYAAEMALLAARRAVPPNGPLDAVDLASACAGTGKVSDVQRSIMLAPWEEWGWKSFGEVVG